VEAADRELLERHVPLLRYDSQAAYRALTASAATDWIGNRLRGNDGRTVAVRGGDPELELSTLSGYPDGAAAQRGDRLDFRPDHLTATQAFQADAAYLDWAYGRVVRGGVLTWLQYWFFYYYNPHALLGLARHEGDWEMVQVGLGSDLEPRAVTFAQHTFGQGLDWDETERHPGPDGGHPVSTSRRSRTLRIRRAAPSRTSAGSTTRAATATRCCRPWRSSAPGWTGPAAGATPRGSSAGGWEVQARRVPAARGDSAGPTRTRSTRTGGGRRPAVASARSSRCWRSARGRRRRTSTPHSRGT